MPAPTGCIGGAPPRWGNISRRRTAASRPRWVYAWLRAVNTVKLVWPRQLAHAALLPGKPLQTCSSISAPCPPRKPPFRLSDSHQPHTSSPQPLQEAVRSLKQHWVNVRLYAAKRRKLNLERFQACLAAVLPESVPPPPAPPPQAAAGEGEEQGAGQGDADGQQQQQQGGGERREGDAADGAGSAADAARQLQQQRQQPVAAASHAPPGQIIISRSAASARPPSAHEALSAAAAQSAAAARSPLSQSPGAGGPMGGRPASLTALPAGHIVLPGSGAPSPVAGGGPKRSSPAAQLR